MAVVSRLRDNLDDLFALVSSASEAERMPPEFVEKDFWVTELLRAAVHAAEADDALVIFKGGTSLSKAYRIIDRFSEDVDILLVPPKGAGEAARNNILKRICVAVGAGLGIPEAQQTLIQSEKGIKRNVRYGYPRRFNYAAVEEGVLLEMGIRGGQEPKCRMALRSIVAQHALNAKGLSEGEYEELQSFGVEVLAAERTLVEKFALLHDLASRFPDQAAVDSLGRAGRHYYDLYKLLDHDATVKAISENGLVARLAIDVASQSEKYKLPFTQRPADGYASSPAFDASHKSQDAVGPAYDRARQLIFREAPSLADCIERVRRQAALL
jgi:Nucleotidyl transferase AbiEii toxin, Type IV TA system